jgi:DNA-binding NarL/FixJ family response regulator
MLNAEVVGSFEIEKQMTVEQKLKRLLAGQAFGGDVERAS